MKPMIVSGLQNMSSIATKLKQLQIRYGWHSLLSSNELVWLIENGVIDAPISAVNGSSIDLTMHHIVRPEVYGASMRKVHIARGESIDTKEIDLDKEKELVMMPHSVALASTIETFNMPLWLSAEFSLKSTLGRNNLGHQLAGWIDPGFSGKITLELINSNGFHKLVLEPGMKIGQVKFFRHKPVPETLSCRVKGQYNGQEKVTQAGKLT